MEKIEVIYAEGRFIAYDVRKAPLLYKEGFYGRPVGLEKPKTLDFELPIELSFYEALYLLKRGRIRVFNLNGEEMSVEELYSEGIKTYDNFEWVYTVYEDLRERGYVVRPGMKFGATFAVYRYGPGIDHAPFLVKVPKPGYMLSALEIVGAGRLTHTVKKRFLIAVPSENFVKYLSFKWFRP